MNYDVTPEKRKGSGVTDPPERYTVLPPKDPARCVGCPYPGVGFICWSPEGSCLKTDLDKFSRHSKGR
jgi:hypothetical protein